ncbi:hypothetical protein IQ272_26175 [Chroococcidiopsidales cyanobacterium LEGE 13417]|uniref:hypothetical protein n=1 Tax=Chroococcidiopsis sp. CCALA 051 TaxID=869949 RepID=UPI001304CFD3|nr:hypothetical protein [Chroococcidiopsis sp. CCALA 051]MBE9019552.1 hypothetical protein [Chroococcidiopsidales cyanobacterium LEGE 13417]
MVRSLRWFWRLIKETISEWQFNEVIVPSEYAVARDRGTRRQLRSSRQNRHRR